MGLNEKLNEEYAGLVVRKDLTKSIKDGANVPIYVLEYLLGSIVLLIMKNKSKMEFKK